MITWIEIERFRGILKGRLDGLTPLTILVGPNGCGKSTVLDALAIGAGPDHGANLSYVLWRNKFLADAARWILWRGVTGTKAAIALGRKRSPRKSATIDVLDPTHVHVAVRTDGGTEVDGGATAARPAILQKWVEGAWIPECHIIDAGATVQAVSLVELFSLASQQGTRKQAVEILRKVVPSLDNVELQTEAGVPTIHLDYGDKTVPASVSGEGVHSLLRMCFELSTRKGGLVVIEEPEVHLHPAAVWQAAGIIVAAVRRGIQVVFSTHSIEFIDGIISECTNEDLPNLSLFRFRLDDGSLVHSRHGGEDVAFAREQVVNDLR